MRGLWRKASGRGWREDRVGGSNVILFLEKRMDLEDILLRQETQSQKTDMWILAQKLRIFLRRGNKMPMEGVTETKSEAETEGTTIQRLPHLGSHPINNHQTQTLWQIPTRAC